MASQKLTRSFPLAVFLGALLLNGCASSGSNKEEEEIAPSNPLTAMVGRHIVVMPSQYLATAGPAGTWDVTPEGPTLLPILDEEIADSFRKKGVNSNWTFAREITAYAIRNGGLAGGDPRQLAAQGIRRIKASDTPLPEPLASQIRSLVTMTSARFVILPIEARVDTRNAERKGTLRVMLIDSRTARVLWVDDVESAVRREPNAATDALTAYGFRIFARELAGRFADMVVAP